jgi:hypothetical protein
VAIQVRSEALGHNMIAGTAEPRLSAAQYRRQAILVRRSADAMKNPLLRDDLIELANWYERRAQGLAAASRDKTRDQ